MANEKIRVPATTVELVQILGVILREHIKVELHGCECWTFERVADWAILEEDDPEHDWSQGSPDVEVRHQMETYLASGYFMAFGHGTDPRNAKRVDVRIRCELSEWVAAYQSFWDFRIWFKFPDGSVERHHYRCFRGYGDDRDIAVENTPIPDQPPRKIAFWKNQTTA